MASRSSAPLENYVNPERLLDDISKLYEARIRVITALDSLDAAARFAGTPIRSTSARERFADLATRLRDIESIARKAWHDELLAAGGMTANLRTVLVKAGASDARALNTLVAKDGLTIDTTEYDELLAVVEGAIVSAKESGVEDYAAHLFASLDQVTLRRLTILLPKMAWATTPTEETVAKARDLLCELRELFAAAIRTPDLEHRAPTFWSTLNTMDPQILTFLLQQGRDWRGDLHVATNADPAVIVRLATRMLIQNPSDHSLDPVHGVSTPEPRLVVLAMLQADLDAGGPALSMFLSTADKTTSGIATATEHLMALVAPKGKLVPSIPWHSPDVWKESKAEATASAKLLEAFFKKSFDPTYGYELPGATFGFELGAQNESTRSASSVGSLQQGADLLKIIISNTSRFTSFTAPMKVALATGFAGAMINPVTSKDLVNSIQSVSSDRLTDTGATIIALQKEEFDTDGTRTLQFVKALASEPKAVRTIAAAFAPMISRNARLLGELPAGSIAEGIGFVYGAILRQFDSNAATRREFYDGLGLGLTVLFATTGALTTGPAGGMAAGALGSGILQNITDLVNLEPHNSEGLPMGENAMREYFRCTYIFACFTFLTPETQARIKDHLLRLSARLTINLKFDSLSGMLRIKNFAGFPPEVQHEIQTTVIETALAEKADQIAISAFATTVAAFGETTRRKNVE